MNRRGFLSALGAGLATVALSTRLATTPLKLADGDFSTDALRFKCTERYVGAWYSHQLAQSMLQTKETMAANVLNRSFAPAVITQPRYRDARVQMSRIMRTLTQPRSWYLDA